MEKTITNTPGIPISTRLLPIFWVITGFVGPLYGENLQGLNVIGVADGGHGWQQTSTIEGTQIIDTRSKTNEPPYSAEFREKYTPLSLPVTILDREGRVIGKTFFDQYGRYSFQHMPKTTNYVDTPFVAEAAFTGSGQFPLDCELPDGAPRIYSVDVMTNGIGGGPYIPTKVLNNENNRKGNTDAIWGTFGEQTITITSIGSKQVPNPNYCNSTTGACPGGADKVNKLITRDYGFGTVDGTVTLGELGTLNCTWGEPITCTVPDATPVPNRSSGQQLTVTRGNDQSTVSGVTVQVGLREKADVVVVGPPTGGQLDKTIQKAIDAANPNDLILVKPGIYHEQVVMWKPVQLQGFGEGGTVINANAPFEKVQTWRDKIDRLLTDKDITLLPGQVAGSVLPGQYTLQTEQGSGVLVLAQDVGSNDFNFNKNLDARIDGFTIESSSTGGGIIVNGHADYLDISNNRIANNQGFYGGGIRVGHSQLISEDEYGKASYTDANNDFVDIHRNQVVYNTGLGGAGGGISMYTGSDSYAITNNWVCGNFSLGDGGGIAHLGVSTNRDEQDLAPFIADNIIIFNESFFPGQTVSGGGLFIAGQQPLTPGVLTPGTGNVQVIGNLIQGNSAGAGDGGGISLAGINGQDVAANPGNTRPDTKDRPQWYKVDIFNNMIANNVAGLAGGGISLQDAVNVHLVYNTIANNDSLAVAAAAFAPGSTNISSPQHGAGIVCRKHSTGLARASKSVGAFSNPSKLANNIVRHNRQFFFKVTNGTPGNPGSTGAWGLCPDIDGTIEGLACPGNDPVYDDMAVVGTAGSLDCSPIDSCITTEDPQFVIENFNILKLSVILPEITTAIQTPPTFIGGGNVIRPLSGPLSLFYDEIENDGYPGTLFSDHHILPTSLAKDAGTDLTGTYEDLMLDFDLEPRPLGENADIGADEVQQQP